MTEKPKDKPSEPSHYKSIEESIKSIKKPILLIVTLGITLQGFMLGIGQNEKKKEPIKFSSLEACYYGMASIFNNSPVKELLASSVLEDIEEIKFSVEKITLIKLLDDYHCDVVAKDRKGYRSYFLSLEKSSKFSHLYKISHIQGQKITSPYQWRKR